MDAGSESAKTGAEVAEELAVDTAQQQHLATYARAKFGISGEDVEDLLQETVLELLRTTCVIRRPAGFVFRIFHTRCCLYLERATMRRVATAGAQPEREDLHDPAYEATDRKLLLLHGFDRISSSCQRLLRAYYLEGKSLKETAAEVAVAYSGVWNLMTRCLRRLRACLER
jgi:RNA polymerase sigma factor (sigma-70 family)